MVIGLTPTEAGAGSPMKILDGRRITTGAGYELEVEAGSGSQATSGHLLGFRGGTPMTIRQSVGHHYRQNASPAPVSVSKAGSTIITISGRQHMFS